MGDTLDESVTVVTGVREFSGLEKPWNALVERDSRHSVFLRHEWLRNAFTYFAPDRDPWTIIVRNGDAMIGALPLMRYVDRWRGFPVRTLGFATDPMSMNVQSDLITADADTTGAIGRIGSFLADHRGEWDYCILDAVPEDSPLLTLANGLMAPGVRIRSTELSWVLHCLDVEGDWDEYLYTHHSYNSRKQLRKDAKRLQKLGKITVEYFTRPEEIEGALEVYFEIELVTSKRSRDNYTRIDDAIRDLYRRLFSDLAKSNLALIGVLRIENRPAAVILTVKYGGVIYTLNEMFDPEYTHGYPGHGLLTAIVRKGFDDGIDRIDFNGYGRHAERFQTLGRKFFRLEIFSPSRTGQILQTYRHGMVPIIKRLLPASLLPQPPKARPGDRGIK